jgi:hypothetical protein
LSWCLGDQPFSPMGTKINLGEIHSIIYLSQKGSSTDSGWNTAQLGWLFLRGWCASPGNALVASIRRIQFKKLGLGVWLKL